MRGRRDPEADRMGPSEVQGADRGGRVACGGGAAAHLAQRHDFGIEEVFDGDRTPLGHGQPPPQHDVHPCSSRKCPIEF